MKSKFQICEVFMSVWYVQDIQHRIFYKNCVIYSYNKIHFTPLYVFMACCLIKTQDAASWHGI